MRLQILEDMDEKLKKIDLFNGQIKEFNVFMKELEDWLPQGRKRMDDLLSPDNPIKAEDRVVQTMELQVSFLIFALSCLKKISKTVFFVFNGNFSGKPFIPQNLSEHPPQFLIQ